MAAAAALASGGSLAQQSTAAIFMSRADYESLKHDPMLILERATQFVAVLEQQDRALREENTLLQQQLKQESGTLSFTPEQHATLVETAAELELDHRELSQKYIDLEHINRMLRGLVDALRNDKKQLTEELGSMKEQQQRLVGEYTTLMNAVADFEEQRETKEARLKIQQEEIDVKIRDLDSYSRRIMEDTKRTIELQDAAEKIGSARLALESETTALEQTTQQQERTLQYLQAEVTHFEQIVALKAQEMVQLKKQMSATILELQLQITKSEEEMTRVRSMVQNENDLTGRQNLWLAKDLKGKLQELLLTRQEMTRENAELKAELVNLREKASRLKSNVLVFEKRNQAFHDTLKRLEEEDQYAKDSYSTRKDTAHQELNEQAARIQQVNQELQTAREDLYMVKSRLCKHCRASILHGGGGAEAGQQGAK